MRSPCAPRRGCEILLHVGLDTVALKGTGFEMLARLNTRVHAGEPLLRFNLDFLAQQARSLLTPVVIGLDSGFRITRRALGSALRAGEFLMEVEARGVQDGAAASARQRRRAGGADQRRPGARAARATGGAAGRRAAQPGCAGAPGRARPGGQCAQHRCTDGPGRGTGGGTRGARLRGGRRGRAGGGAQRAHACRSRPSGRGAARARHAPGAARGPARGRTRRGHRQPRLCRGAGGAPAARRRCRRRSRAQGLQRSRRRWRAPGRACARCWRAAPAWVADAAREIAQAHLELLDDPELLAAAQALIAQGKGAGFAWRQSIRAYTAVLASLADARLRERVDDLMDLEDQVLSALQPAHAAAAPAAAGAGDRGRPRPAALAAARPGGRAAWPGCAPREGGATSHVAILAAAMGIPALAALGAGSWRCPRARWVVLDAEARLPRERPGRGAPGRRRRAGAARSARVPPPRSRRRRPQARTRDGTRIQVLANVGSVAEARAAVRNGAEGCGLLRTEFLFLDRQSAPTQEEQTHAYQQIADALGARPLTIRTLDAGGDKPIAYLQPAGRGEPGAGPARRAHQPGLPRAAARAAARDPRRHRSRRSAACCCRWSPTSRTWRRCAPCSQRCRPSLPARPALRRGRHDRDAGIGGAGRRAGAGGGFPVHRHERSYAVRAGDGPRPPAARRTPGRAAPGGADPHRAHRRGGPCARAPCRRVRRTGLRAGRRRLAGGPGRGRAVGRAGGRPAGEGAARARHAGAMPGAGAAGAGAAHGARGARAAGRARPGSAP